MARRQVGVDVRRIAIRSAAFACLAALCAVMSGCVYSAYLTPETLPPGGRSFGLAATYHHSLASPLSNFEPGAPEVGLMTRVGITPNVEAGLRLSFPSVVMVDAKYQFLRRRLLLAADLGFSYCFWPVHYIWYPMLLVGTERYYAGLRAMYVLERDRGYVPAHDNANTLAPGLVIGASFGRRFRIVPELNVYYAMEGDPIERCFVIGGGLCLEYRL